MNPSPTALTRWIVSPLVLAFVGLMIGVLGSHWAVDGELYDPPLFVILLTIGALVGARMTIVLRELEQAGRARRQHFRQSLCAYVLILPCSAAYFGGGFGSVVFSRPFAPLLGVVIGNLTVSIIGAEVHT